MHSSTLRRGLALGLTIVCTGLAAGCGGDDKKADSNRDQAYGTAATGGGAEVVAERVASAAPLGGVADFATTPTYQPTGKIVADSGFRPETDGFSFINTGNDIIANIDGELAQTGETWQNLTPADMAEIFGDQVCIDGTSGEECKLIPVAEKWMAKENEGMDGGHCMGFSVASLRIFAGKLKAADYGGEQTAAIPIEENAELQRLISKSFIYQTLDVVNENAVSGTPKEVLDAIITSIKDGKDYYTLGFYKADGSGGHAVTPLAVEDNGGGNFTLLVYDNNYPGVTRPFEFDTNADTYSYVGSSNPEVAEDVYEGAADTPQMRLMPTLVADGQQPCSFCDGELLAEEGEVGAAGGSVGSKLGTAPSKEEAYNELSLVGPVENHPHLVLTNDKDQVTGIYEGKVRQEIEGVEMVFDYGQDEEYGAVPEPSFKIKPGTDFSILVDGSALEKRSKNNTINYSGGGLVVEIDEINVAPGQIDILTFADNYGFYYASDSKSISSPLFFAGVYDGDVSYTFGAAAVGLKKGSSVGLFIDQEDGTVDLDSSESKGQDGLKGEFILAVERIDAKSDSIWTKNVALDGKKDESLIFNYKDKDLKPTPGKKLSLLRTSANGKSEDKFLEAKEDND